MREFAIGRFVANQDNVLMLGSPGVGKTHLAVALGRSMAKISNLVLGTTATALIGALAEAENSGQLKKNADLVQQSKTAAYRRTWLFDV